MMNFCPQCGKKLELEKLIEDKTYKACSCGYIDFDNWVNVSAVIYAQNDDHQVLMIRMRKNHTYTFPGGFRDLGETLEEAARRECLEETGFIVDHLQLFHTATLDASRLVWVVFKADIIGGHKTLNDEVDDILFVDIKDLENIEPMRGPLSSGLLKKIVDSHKKNDR